MGLRVLAAIGAVLAVIAVVVVPRRLAPRELFENHAQRLGVENEIRRTIIQMLGGAFVLASVFFTYQTVRVSQESLELTARGQITERFTRAIDQIGNERLDVAIGGIYALGQLARESRTEHAAIMEILTTYIHEHSPDRMPKECGTSPIEGDVQAAINVIADRNIAFDATGSTIELDDVNLAAGDFSSGNFDYVVFSGSCLHEANFQYAQTENADFSTSAYQASEVFDPTILEGALFNDAHAAGANFEAVQAWPIDMVNADLRGANLSRANLGGVRGPAAKLGSDLTCVDLRDAELVGGRCGSRP
ncbi:MAG TPA: pentapeptide repeat-containing protein [Actinomycetota bacterium]